VLESPVAQVTAEPLLRRLQARVVHLAVVLQGLAKSGFKRALRKRPSNRT
jgi:hypothetical protein